MLAGRQVSRVGYGAMQLARLTADRNAALAVLRRAVELGVDHVDTAQFYGDGFVLEGRRVAGVPLRPCPTRAELVTVLRHTPGKCIGLLQGRQPLRHRIKSCVRRDGSAVVIIVRASDVRGGVVAQVLAQVRQREVDVTAAGRVN